MHVSFQTVNNKSTPHICGAFDESNEQNYIHFFKKLLSV
uniref:Uncharacterized protein n=1 Tax=uncultured bacterium A1Q1_fos_1266 TaxID=1256546 RepID=L7VT07_9BACT|nr:hypothetical protein [uncultured bacterium A1Q1_fos_1266]